MTCNPGEALVDLRVKMSHEIAQRDARIAALMEALDIVPALLMLTQGPPYTLSFSETALKKIHAALSGDTVATDREKELRQCLRDTAAALKRHTSQAHPCHCDFCLDTDMRVVKRALALAGEESE